MKLSILPLTLASAGLLASASPMRVVIVSSAMGTPDSGPVAQMERPVFRLRPAAEATNGVTTKHHAPCGRLRQKATSISNAFKMALGFTVSDNHGHVTSYESPPFIGTPNAIAVEGKTQGGDRLHIFPVDAFPAPTHAHGHGHGHRFHHQEKHSFLMRVHFALMSLGPWEGRAVAFVLGCGIGVLLRMLWVMAVISYRMIKGPRSAEEEHEYTVVDLDAEEIFVAPPHYTYPVEKVEIVDSVAAESK
ncbi:hypothetical protein C8R43DRAFT_1032722 [Mycena crocata]|nr:hypothetical protein C8R43DRAFT_1032722 [Mycena crocata]